MSYLTLKIIKFFDKKTLNICLPPPGWGKTENGEQPSELLEVEVPVTSNKVCQAALKQTEMEEEVGIDQNQICAGGKENKDSCSVKVSQHSEQHLRLTSLFIRSSSCLVATTLTFVYKLKFG